MLYRMYTSFNVKQLQRCEESSLIHKILSDTAQSMLERTMHLTLSLVRKKIIYTTHFTVSNIYKHFGKKNSLQRYIHEKTLSKYDRNRNAFHSVSNIKYYLI